MLQMTYLNRELYNAASILAVYHTTSTMLALSISLSIVMSFALSILAMATIILSCSSFNLIFGRTFITWKLKDVAMKFLLISIL